MPKLIVDELRQKIDTSVTHSIRGASGENRSLGTTSASTRGYKKYWPPNVVMCIERLEAIGIFQFFQFQTF